MKLNNKAKRISGLSMIMLVVGMILVTPVLACPAGTPCSQIFSKTPHTEITGVERDANIAFALNLRDVQKLSGNLYTINVKQIEDAAKVYSIEKNMTNGSTKNTTTVILPVKTVTEDNNSVQITDVIAVWNGESASPSPKVMSVTYTFKNKKVDELIFSRVDDNGEIVNSTIVSHGSLVQNVKDSKTGFFAATSGFWNCVADYIIGDCWCEVLGLPCPPTEPSICGFCLSLLTPCYMVPNAITCGPAAICMGLELAIAMNACY